MSIFQLRCLAIFAMIVDHAGLFFFPDVIALRIVGRMSFPIFAWLIANGAHRTHDINSYLVRLLIFAFLSQPFFWATGVRLDPAFDELNVRFKKVLGLLAIAFIQRSDNIFLRVILVVLCAGASNFIKADYGAMGVLSIVFFYIFYSEPIWMWVSQIFIYAGGYWLWLPIPRGDTFYAGLAQYILQLTALFALFFISLYNGRQGMRIKYFFYIIYPLQYVVIYLLQVITG